ncbi:MAG: hypothetical protein ABI333_26160, partial [bacterium]
GGGEVSHEVADRCSKLALLGLQRYSGVFQRVRRRFAIRRVGNAREQIVALGRLALRQALSGVEFSSSW